MIAQNGFRRYPSGMQHGPRLKALQSLLRREKLAALLVTTPANVLYLTGLDASEAILLVQPASATLFVDGRYAEAARARRTKALRVSDRADIATAMRKIRRCGYEEHHVTAARVRRWKTSFKNTKFVHTLGLTEGLRRKKDSQEIIRMKRALAITDEVLRLVPRMLVRGITEKALAAKILLAMLDRGADGMAFDPIVGFGANSSMPHHRTGDRKLRARDIVQIDVGARYKGYCSDRSEVYFVGEPTAEQRRAYDAVRDAKNAAKAMLRAGARGADLDAAARTLIRERGFAAYPHALGHGLGLDIHEGVTLSEKSSDTLLSGEALTVEPGIYVPGKFGIRLEDTVFVK